MLQRNSELQDESGFEELTTIMIAQLNQGDREAEAKVVQRYSERLLLLASVQIGAHIKSRLDPEDAVQSALASFLWRIRDGQFQFDSSAGLWRLLSTIVLNKIRRAGRKRGERGFLPADIPDDQLSPLEIATFVDEVESLLRGLPKRCGDVALLVMEGYSVSEMAARLECSRWTIRRALDKLTSRARRRVSDSR